MAKNEQCAILTPAYGRIRPKTEDALRTLQDRGYVVRILRGSSQIDLARSTLATRAMRDGFRETLWIDADTRFDPDDVDRLRDNDEPFIAGLYSRKGKKEFAAQFLDSMTGVTFGPAGGVIEMQYVGMGFTYVRSDVYAELARGLPVCKGGYDGETVIPFFIPMLAQEQDGSSVYLSEDFSFSLRARNAGFPPHADTRIKIGHTGGDKDWEWEDMLATKSVDALYLGDHKPPQALKQPFAANGAAKELASVS